MNAVTTFESLKTPPHSNDAEQGVLGGLLLDGESFGKVAGVVGEDDFYRLDHQLIYRSIAALRDDNHSAGLDVITLSNWLGERNLLDDAGGLSYLATMAKDTPSARRVAEYAEIVREKSLQRQFIAIASEAVDSGFRSEGRSAAELLDSLDRKLTALSEQARKKKLKTTRLRTGVKRELKALDERSKQHAENGDSLLGADTGSVALNDALSGLVDGDLVIVAGRPSMGKSALEGDLALAVAHECDKAGSGGVLEINLEMPDDAIIQRHMARASSVSLQSIRKSWELTEDAFPRLAGAVKAFNDLPLWICDGARAGVSSLADICTLARAEHRRLIRETGAGLKLMTLDYLQLMTTDSGFRGPGNRTEDVSTMSRGLKLLAKELNCPVVVLSQLNRSLEQRPNKRPVMSDLRDSGAIEQDADVIIFVYRDEVYNPETAEKGVAEIIIAKQRNGPIGTERMVFEGQYVRFRDYTNQYDDYRETG